MTETQTNANLQEAEPVSETGETIMDIVRRLNIPIITLPTDKNGHAFVDKDKYPDLYDWAVNG